MPASQHRLDRYISKLARIPRGNIRLLIAQGKISVDNERAHSIHQTVNQFSKITLNGALLSHQQAIYIAYHKPMGILSATKDTQHKTVLDALSELNNLNLSEDELASLHIAGRLDKSSSGLILLTNDSRWSKRLMSPGHKVLKRYHVVLENPISEECQQAFAKGMFFEYENCITQPARLEKLNEYEAEIFLTEGKYHQIKRMFGRFRNPVLRLHRTEIGPYSIQGLAEGQARHLDKYEIQAS